MKKKWPSHELAYRRNYHQIVKDKLFAAYGGYRCSCCGETEPKFLQLDHIHNDGYKHRRLVSKSQKCGLSIYQDLIKRGFPPIIQVLCANCNFGKSRNGGVCPHKAR